MYCGGVDCWCEGLSGTGGCSGGVRWNGCVSSGLRGAVYCDGVGHGESGSYVCVCSHLG